jgi:hypothetical protein
MRNRFSPCRLGKRRKLRLWLKVNEAAGTFHTSKNQGSAIREISAILEMQRGIQSALARLRAQAESIPITMARVLTGVFFGIFRLIQSRILFPHASALFVAWSNSPAADSYGGYDRRNPDEPDWKHPRERFSDVA